MRISSMGACLLVFLALTIPAASEETSAKEKPCRADAERYCASVGKEKGARSRCLREHQAELSPACRERLQARHRRSGGSKRIGGVEDVCGADLEQHCPDAEMHGAQVRCLRAHADELSAKCSERLTKKRGRKKPQPES